MASEAFNSSSMPRSLARLATYGFDHFIGLYVDFVKVGVKPALGEKCGVTSSFVLFDVVAVKESVFADFVFLLLCDFEHRVVLFSVKLVFDAVLSDVLFHNSYSFRVTKFLVNTSIFGTLGICFDHLGTVP